MGVNLRLSLCLDYLRAKLRVKCLDDQIKEVEVNTICNTNVKNEKCVHNFDVETSVALSVKTK